MFSNGVTQDYEAFATSHRTVYATEISYSVEYDEEAWVGNGRQGCRSGVDHYKPPGSRPDSHRGRVDRQLPRRPHYSPVGDDLAEPGTSSPRSRPTDQRIELCGFDSSWSSIVMSQDPAGTSNPSVNGRSAGNGFRVP